MRRLAFGILIFFVTVSSHAGFKFYGAGGQFMDSADDPDDSAPQEYESSVPALPISPAQSVKKPATFEYSPQHDNVDMSGVEWLQRRGSYDGRRTGVTRAEGYRAGTYTLDFSHRGKSNFIVWINTRRGLRDLLVNRIGSVKTSQFLTLDKDDEVFFDVRADGGWKIIMERAR